jgi:hypothetical protein
MTASDIGTPFAQGSQLVGMLTAIPSGAVTKTPPAIYNLHRALRLMRKSPRVVLHHHHHRTVARFHHLKLLRAGQRP